MTRCVIYCRVSTDAQERDGTSLETQLVACRDYAAGQGWITVSEIRDSSSGFTLERPGMEQIRRILKDATADVILASRRRNKCKSRAPYLPTQVSSRAI